MLCRTQPCKAKLMFNKLTDAEYMDARLCFLMDMTFEMKTP